MLNIEQLSACRVANHKTKESFYIGSTQEVWNITESSADQYSDTFQKLLDEQNITLMSLVEKNRPFAVVADLMSTGRVLNHDQLRPDYGLSVSLGSVYVSRRERLFGKVHLKSNIRFDKTWKDIDAWLKQLPTETCHHFDLVTARPMGAIKCLPQTPEFHLKLAQLIWDRLDDNGVFLTQTYNFPELKTWVALLKQTGIIVLLQTDVPPTFCDLDTANILLKKTAGAPEQLPILY